MATWYPRAELKDRMRELFPGTYLALVGIIQGLAITLLVLEWAHDPRWRWVHAIQYATCFVVIAIVWHEYYLGSWLFDWLPRFRDSLVPFVMGSCEALLILSVQGDPPFGHDESWIHANVSFALAGTLFFITASAAYWNLYRQTFLRGELDTVPHDMIGFYSMTRRMYRRNVVEPLVGAVVLLGVHVFAPHAVDRRWPGVLSAIVFCVGVLLPVNRSRIMLNALEEEPGPAAR